MSADTLRAAQLYADAARLAANTPRTDEISTAREANFGEMVKAAIETTSADLQAGEAAAAKAVAGEANLVDVVTAVSAAEVTLETAIAVRNRVIEAYQNIMRMPI